MAAYTQDELVDITNELSALRRGVHISGEIIKVLTSFAHDSNHEVIKGPGIASGIELTS